jgi:hypothetical protein
MMMNENMEQETQGKTTNSINNQDNQQSHNVRNDGETMPKDNDTQNLLRLKSGYCQHVNPTDMLTFSGSARFFPR